MNLKFLPLGSVCLVDNSDLKLVVIGYKLNGYDYVAVDYPIGYENEGSLRYFNHDQIKDLYSYGYKDEQGKNHFVALDDGTPNAINSELGDNGFKFDDMGIVIADETAAEAPNVVEDNNPGFFFDEKGVVVVDTTAPELIEEIPTVQEAVTPVETGFQFDENGVVVADATAPVVVDVPVESGFQFDENGVVVADATAPVVEVAPVESGFQFDENGVVVADATALVVEDVPVESGFQFDENGVVVADATAPLIPSVNNFQFDENGVVISDNGVTEESLASSPVESEDAAINFNEDGTVTLDEEDNSIFGEVEAPGVVEEHKDEVVFEEKVEEESANFDIPAPETAIVPEEDTSVAAFETTTEETPVVEKKEEKKKKGFFNFGK